MGSKNEGLTKIIIVLDRSGSMQSIKSDTIGGFNAFLEEQKKIPGKAVLTLIQFDDEYEVIYDNLPLEDVKPLNEDTFIPRGWTALLDAIGMSIGTALEQFNKTSEEDRPGQMVVAILTDGHENSSREYSKKQVFNMVDQVQKNGWEVLYLGADRASVDEASSYGFKLDKTYCFDGTYINAGGLTISGTQEACSTMSVGIADYRTSGKKIKS